MLIVVTQFQFIHIGIQVIASDSTIITGPTIDPIIVGSCETLTCTTDLDVESIEWVLVRGPGMEEVVVSSTEQEANLVFAPINDSVHQLDYKCTITSPYGAQEQIITLVITGIDHSRKL